MRAQQQPAALRQKQCVMMRARAGLMRRDFLLANYAEVKKANPAFPILIREAPGVEAKLVGRYGECMWPAQSCQCAKQWQRGCARQRFQTSRADCCPVPGPLTHIARVLLARHRATVRHVARQRTQVNLKVLKLIARRFWALCASKAAPPQHRAWL